MKRIVSMLICLLFLTGIAAFAENTSEIFPVMHFDYWMTVEDVSKFVNSPYREQGFLDNECWNVWVWGEMQVEASPFLWYTLSISLDEEVPGVKVCDDLSITMVEYGWRETDGAKSVEVKSIGTMISLDKKLYAREDIGGILKELKLSSPVDKMLLTDETCASDQLMTVDIPVVMGDIREMKPTGAGKKVHILLEREDAPRGNKQEGLSYQSFLWRPEDPSVFEGEASYFFLVDENSIFYGELNRGNLISVEGGESLTAEEAALQLTERDAFLLVSPVPQVALVSTEYVGPYWVMECTFGAGDVLDEAEPQETEEREINWDEWDFGE